MEIKSALVTGSNGLVGKNLVNKLKSLGVEVTILERSEITEVQEDLEKLNLLINNKVLELDVVFHVGANAYTADFSSDVLFSNYYVTKLLIDRCSHEKIDMIFSSTQMVNGRKELGYPENLYGWSKLIGEQYGLMKARIDWSINTGSTTDWHEFKINDPFRFIALRYSNIYGPDESHKGVAASLAYTAWERGEIDLWDANRDFVYVDDVVDANIFAYKKPIGIYDVGSGQSRSAIDLVRNMGDNIKITEKPSEEAPPWFQWYTESKKENFIPGWLPKFDLEQGTAAYKKYLENKS